MCILFVCVFVFVFVLYVLVYETGSVGVVGKVFLHDPHLFCKITVWS